MKRLPGIYDLWVVSTPKHYSYSLQLALFCHRDSIMNFMSCHAVLSRTPVNQLSLDTLNTSDVNVLDVWKSMMRKYFNEANSTIFVKVKKCARCFFLHTRVIDREVQKF